MVGRRISVGALLIAAALMVSGCGNGSPSISTTPPGSSAAVDTTTDAGDSAADPGPDPDPGLGRPGDDATYQIPTVGQCRTVTKSKPTVASDSSPPIDCSKPHNAITYYVGQLPPDLPLTTKRDATWQRRAAAVVSAGCVPRLAKASGATNVQLTLLSSLWFVPTTEQAQQGARWYRCDVVAYSGYGAEGGVRGLVNLPATTPISTAQTALQYRWCMAGDFSSLPCAKPHTYTARKTVRHDTGTGWPGPDAAKKTIAQACAKALGRTERIAWWLPDQAQWDASDTVVFVCFTSP